MPWQAVYVILGAECEGLDLLQGLPVPPENRLTHIADATGSEGAPARLYEVAGKAPVFEVGIPTSV